MPPSPRHSEEPREPTLSEEVTPELVLAYLATLSQPSSVRRIAHGMGLRHHGRRFLPRVLQKLKKRGDVEEIHGGRFQLAGAKQARNEASGRAAAAKRNARAAGSSATGEAPQPTAASPSEKTISISRGTDPNLVSGRIVAHRDGYAFLVPDTPMLRVEGDLFIGRDGLGDAMHGDRVLARISHRRADGRAEGRVVQIVKREHPTIVGLFRYGPHGNVVLPYDTRLHHEIAIPPGEELTPALREKLGITESLPARSRTRLPELDGAVVNVEMIRFPKGGLAPTGREIEIVGRPGEIGVDVEIIIRKHHLPHIFDDEVLAEARSKPQQVREADLRERRDFRNLPIVTIDGGTARDFDDAVLVTQLPDGNYELQVHIADVAHYVERGSRAHRRAAP